MCVKEWKRIAEWEAKRYRDRKAFLRGVADAGGKKTARADLYERWVQAIETVLRYLDLHDPEKARFFRMYYGTDGGQPGCRKKGMIAMTFAFHAGESTLYEWRKDLLSLLLIAAAQTGALKPFHKDAQ